MKKTISIVVIMTLFLLGIGFMAGFQYNSQTMVPKVKTITQTEYVQLQPEVIIKVVTETVTETITEVVEKVVEIPAETREFETLQELRDYAVGTIYLPWGENVCLSLCRNYYQQCLKDGYQVSMMPLSYYEYSSRFENPVPGKFPYWHMVIMAVVGTDVYLYEPQTGEIVHFGKGY